MRFGQHLRQSINFLLNVKQRKAEMKQALLEQGVDPKIIEGLIFQDVTQTAKNFKMAISTRPTNMTLLPQNSQVEINAYNALRPVLDSYGKSIYYDAKAQPENHFMAFVQLAPLFETLGLSPFRCFPLRRSWSPGYVQIDNIRWSNNIDKLEYWKQVNKLLRFRGTIQTDGVGITVLKKRIDRQSSYTSTIKEADEKFKYISDLSTQEHKAVNGRCVAIDPGRRDLLFCVDEKSTVETPIKFRYTKQDQDKTRKSKKYRNILQEMKSNNPAVYQAENALAENQSSSLEMEAYRCFLERLGQNYAVLDDLYGYTTTSSQNPQFMLRKLRLAAYFNKQRVDMQLINSLKQKFGKDAIFVLGNWSAPNARYHEPIRDIGLRRLLLRNHLSLLLIDEFNTSRCCPSCHNLSLEKFKQIDNPRPYQRSNYPLTLCHGLLRDLAACLNMISIILYLRNTGQIPERFARHVHSKKTSSNR
ncbi:uncharacterized protein EV154DRAFT_545503 [Mucor mucedo]|uniref:uncharacterized protein n=1 Tax=Mucor mucedo TaxID=29922 RepID=UPI00222056B8|nr:uncharacterized protein EV154DRAFT_545503 [Mucor mucedo]KAI7883370.1 hypothetical protein EV154DRAFT_545503 [Mucor mucedo]